MFQQYHPIAWTYHRSTSYLRQGGAAPVDPPPLMAPSAEYNEPAHMKEYPAATKQRLPQPLEVPLALADAIARRSSCRRFAPAALPLAALSTLLRNAYGLGATYCVGELDTFERPVPSGGGCYPLEIYLVARNVDGVAAGIHHYATAHHALEPLGPPPKPEAVTALFLDQPWLANAHVVAVITAVTSRLLHRYGDRGYRYTLIEAGHVGQNLALTAAALGLGSLSLGGFYDDDIARMLGLDPAFEIALYGVALGVPDTADRNDARGLEIPRNT